MSVGSAPVALVIANLGAGGAERVLVNLAAGLADRGVTVRLIALDAEGPLAAQVHPDVELVDLGGRRARTALPSLLRALRSDPPRAIIASQTHVNLLLALARPLLPRGARLIVREPQLHGRDTDRSTVQERVTDRILARADVVVASSEAMAERLASHFGRRGRPVVVPNPVDVDGLRAAAASRPGPAAADRPLRLIAVGRLVEEKGHADLIAALADPSLAACTLTLVGDGPLRSSLTQQVAALGLAERVSLRGQVDDRAELATLIARADLLVQPAHYEGMPNTVLEALALGTPVLGTTDLPMLEELARLVPDGAVRLVPRAALVAAIAEARPSPAPIPRPCLLPAHFRVAAVTDRFLDLIGAADA